MKKFNQNFPLKLKEIQRKYKKTLNINISHPMKKAGITVLFLFGCAYFGAMVIFGEHGMLHLINLQKEYKQLTQNNLNLEKENRKLRTEIELLKTDLNYIENLARKELGLVKSDELIYQFVVEDERGKDISDRLPADENH